VLRGDFLRTSLVRQSFNVFLSQVQISEEAQRALSGLPSPSKHHPTLPNRSIPFSRFFLVFLFSSSAHSQPARRHRLGLLEKKKDYKLRAEDYNEKKKRIQKLKEKAALRNPDEFYYKMQSLKTGQSGHVIGMRKTKKLEQKAIEIMKLQDQSFLALRTQMEKKVIHALDLSIRFCF
jgi:hypothetical protein